MLLTIDGRGFLGPSAFRTVCWFKNQLGERAKYGPVGLSTQQNGGTMTPIIEGMKVANPNVRTVVRWTRMQPQELNYKSVVGSLGSSMEPFGVLFSTKACSKM